MVHTIPVVTHGAKINRDSRQSSGNGYNGNQSNHLFAQILESAVDEQTKAPAHCHTVTYGNDRRLHTFLYQSREYQY